MCLAKAAHNPCRRASSTSFPRRGNTTVAVERKPTESGGPQPPQTGPVGPNRGRQDVGLCNPFRAVVLFGAALIRRLPPTATFVWPFSGPKRHQDGTRIGIRHWVLTRLTLPANHMLGFNPRDRDAGQPPDPGGVAQSPSSGRWGRSSRRRRDTGFSPRGSRIRDRACRPRSCP